MDIRDAPAEYRKRGKNFKDAIDKALLQAASRTVTYIVSQVIPTTQVDGPSGSRRAPPVDRGPYKAGFRASRIPNGAKVHHVNPKLAAIVEYGVRPGNVKIGRKMIRALAEWAHRHGLEASKEDPERVAWAIAKGMQKYGMAPRNVFERARPKAREFAKQEINRIVKTHLSRS